MLPNASPKPRKRVKRKPKGLKRSPMTYAKALERLGKKLKFASAHSLKRSPMKRGKSVLRSKGGPPRDTERMAYIRLQPCHICTKLGRAQVSRSDPDHVKTRGAGGKEAANLVPHCRWHHDERHRIGVRAFEYRYNANLKAVARFYEDRYTLNVFRQGGIGI